VPFVKNHTPLIVSVFLFLVRKRDSKNFVALKIQRIAAANYTLQYFNVLSAESAGWNPIKEANCIQVPFYRSKSRKDASCQSQGMPT
jgi:hypothetical protein